VPPEMSAKRWEALVDSHFGFLRTDFQSVITGTAEENWWSLRTSYHNPTTAVEVLYSGEFERVEVLLVRLVDGKRPPAPIFTSEAPVLHHFDLANVLKLRAPDELRAIEPHFSLNPDEVEVQLSLWASALKKHGADVVRGDFSAFAVLEAERREFVRSHPEQMTVWFPHTAKGPDDREVARIRSFAPTIPLVVRQYTRPSRPLGDRLRRLLRRLVSRR
jgi:hypothetical protein